MKPAPPVREAELQEAILELAGVFGWLRYHTHDSRHSAKGFPDLVLLHPRWRLLVFAELKAADGKVSREQAEWGSALRELSTVIGMQLSPPTPGRVRYYVWRPDDWQHGIIERVLRGL